jgi:hypothetical protein
MGRTDLGSIVAVYSRKEGFATKFCSTLAEWSSFTSGEPADFVDMWLQLCPCG